MSADNGIYILSNPDELGLGRDYRVKETGQSCIESMDVAGKVGLAYESWIFGDCSPIYSEEEAKKLAFSIESDYLEYGVGLVVRDHPFPKMSEEEIMKLIQGENNEVE